MASSWFGVYEGRGGVWLISRNVVLWDKNVWVQRRELHSFRVHLKDCSRSTKTSFECIKLQCVKGPKSITFGSDYKLHTQSPSQRLRLNIKHTAGERLWGSIASYSGRRVKGGSKSITFRLQVTHSESISRIVQETRKTFFERVKLTVLTNDTLSTANIALGFRFDVDLLQWRHVDCIHVR